MQRTLTLLALALAMTGVSAADTTKLTVNGMVCAFCAQGIEKRLGELPQTQAVYVNLGRKIVAVQAKEGQALDVAVLKHEISEMALVEVPAALRDVGITVMDGPFFSMMPFPSRRLHTLSHVRYTPHASWIDRADTAPYEVLAKYPRHSRYERMLRDAGRYLPSLLGSRHADSLFEVKTVLTKNEGDDGRPILFEHSEQFPGFYSILGGKIDNIYDIYEKLDAERFYIPQP